MSSSASISAAKKRRANQLQPPPTVQQPLQRPGTPSLANMTPAQRQQFMLQQQQRMQQQQQQQPQQQQSQQQQQKQQQQQQKQPAGNQKATTTKSPGLSWPMPPIYLMKQMDNILFQQSQSIDEMKNRLNCIEAGGLPDLSDGEHGDGGSGHLVLEQTKHSLLVDDEFVSGIVDNIMNNSNLADIIEQIDTVQNENRELRELLHAQQKTINEMNVMLLKLISQSLTPQPVPASVPASAVPASDVPASAVPVPVAADVLEEEPEDDSSGENNIQMDVIDSIDSNMQIVD
jgi:hypothetical protein